jgi:two-component system sensor kinase FixL
MAAGTYTRLVNDAMTSGNADMGTIAETAKKAVAQVERAAEVVRQLRALVRLDRSSRAPCRLARIAEEAIELCRPDLERAHIAVETKLAPELPPVMVDLLQIEQVVINLVRNAIEAISESGSPRGIVRIEAKQVDGAFIEVRVVDSGPGFPPQFREGAFLPLSSHKTEGLGIGLSLCRSIVEAHGGQLWLDDGRHGAAIRFTLPIGKASEP